nr:MAG TPA: hypothetical protein [Caudoviricetes sp.]
MCSHFRKTDNLIVIFARVLLRYFKAKALKIFDSPTGEGESLILYTNKIKIIKANYNSKSY